MFTIEEIYAAHAKVKSGEDFPSYIQDISKMGVREYEYFVKNGNTIYTGLNHTIETDTRYETLVIAEKSNKPQFLLDLKLHQQGKSDFATFCNECAINGIEKWVVDLLKLTCTYYDKTGNQITVENIPSLFP